MVLFHFQQLPPFLVAKGGRASRSHLLFAPSLTLVWTRVTAVYSVCYSLFLLLVVWMLQMSQAGQVGVPSVFSVFL